MKKKKNTIYVLWESKLLSLLGTIFLALTLPVLENTFLAGVFSVGGLLLLLMGGRRCKTTSDVVVNGLLLWLGHGVRFSGLFGTKIGYLLLMLLLFSPYILLLIGALFLDRWLEKKGHSLLALLVLPLVYGMGAFLMAEVNLGFMTNLISYLLCIPILSVNLSLYGEYVLSAMLLFILLSLFSLLWEKQKKTRIAVSLLSLLLAVVLLVGGTVVRGQYEEADYTLKIALATQQELDFAEFGEELYSEEKQLEIFTEQLKKSEEEKADLLVLCEEYFTWAEENLEERLSEVASAVKTYGIPTLLCFETYSEENLSVNEAVYMDGEGNILYTYVKNNLVPLVEAGYYVDGEEKPATLTVTLGGQEIDIAIVICYDVNDEVYLQKIPDTTELLLVPSWDWDRCNLEQRRTALRSATLGLTMVKHSYDGFSTVSNPRGEVTAEVDFRGQYESVQTVTVPIWKK